MPGEIVLVILATLSGAVIITAISVLGWVHNTRLKIRYGYPLESMWGRPLHPRTSAEEGERIRILGQDNAQLRAELSRLGERLVNVERIVTDRSYGLDAQIAALGQGQDKAP